MKSIVLDAGPIISLAINNMLQILEPLKKKFNGSFYITDSVKRELVDRPFEIKKFKFEAIQIQKLIDDRTIEVINDSEIAQKTPSLLNTANQIFKAYNNYIKIVHFAEMSVIIAASKLNSNAIVVDEKTTRLLIENSKVVADILSRTLHTHISINESNLKEFRNLTRGIQVIRSAELVTVAYEYGILDKYLTSIPDPRRNLLDGLLWGVKINGCAVSKEEIGQIIKMEIK